MNDWTLQYYSLHNWDHYRFWYFRLCNWNNSTLQTSYHRLLQTWIGFHVDLFSYLGDDELPAWRRVSQIWKCPTMLMTVCLLPAAFVNLLTLLLRWLWTGASSLSLSLSLQPFFSCPPLKNTPFSNTHKPKPRLAESAQQCCNIVTKRPSVLQGAIETFFCLTFNKNIVSCEWGSC